MDNFSILLYSLKSTSVLKISGNETPIDGVVMELLSIFNPNIDPQNRAIQINPLHKKTDDIVRKISDFVDKYKLDVPLINKFNTFIKKLDTDEYFFIVPGAEKLSDQENITIGNILLCHNENRIADFNKIQSDYQKIFGNIVQNYKILTTDIDKKHYIGNKAKKDRKCRFCGETDPKKFISEAHAISEALGNKNVILFDECDTCNAHFSATIEKDLITYLDLYRTFFGIKNKSNNIPKVKGRNFEYINAGNKTIILKHCPKDDSEKNDFPNRIPLEFYDKITLQNIYKALSKFALSIVPIEYFKNFEKTTSWIRNDQFTEKLPKVGILRSYGPFFNKHPQMTVYIRQTTNNEIPYAVGEFHFTFLIFVFIIPTFDENEKNYFTQPEYDSFLNCFKHYQGMKNWSFEDYSNNEDKEIIFNMIFEQNKI